MATESPYLDLWRDHFLVIPRQMLSSGVGLPGGCLISGDCVQSSILVSLERLDDMVKGVGTKIGYIGVDVLNNATICNEATGLLDAGVLLDVVTVYRHDKATYYQDDSLASLRSTIWSIYPLGIFRPLWALFFAPWVFGIRFWTMLTKAIFGPVEGWKQRARIIYQVLPSVVLALRWRHKNIGHIHAHWAHTATSIAMHTAELLGVGFSFTGHANDLFVHRVGLIAKIRRARFIVCISEYHRRFYLDLGADAARLVVVYCGIDLARFAPGSGDLTRKTRRVLSVGRLVEKKGFADLIEACGLLRDRGVELNCVIAGSGPDLGRLRQQVTELGLENVVRLTGETVLQEGLPALLDSARVFALACVQDRDGDMDGLPQVLIESLLQGVPSVSTRLVGIPDLIRDDETGFLVTPGDTSALADAIEILLDDDELAARLAAAGAEWSREHFGRDVAVRRMATLFAEASATDGRSPLTYHPTAAPGAEAEYAPNRQANRLVTASI